MATHYKDFVTAERYLELERAANHKSEYKDGVVYAMAGGSGEHAGIAMNLGSELRSLFRGQCRAFGSDLKIYIPKTNGYVYPDVSLICGAVQYQDDANDVALNPVLVAEVLSDSTRGYDRGDKFNGYRSIPSFREYLVVEQTHVSVEQWFMRDGLWTLLAEYTELTDQIELKFSGAAQRLSVAGVYDGIQLR